MAFNGSEGGTIDRTKAQDYLLKYRNSNAYTANAGKEAILFGKNHINSILQQAGCMGVRIYYGKEGTADTAAPHMMLVGYDSEGNDMTGIIVDTGMPCPDYCSSPSTHL